LAVACSCGTDLARCSKFALGTSATPPNPSSTSPPIADPRSDALEHRDRSPSPTAINPKRKCRQRRGCGAQETRIRLTPKWRSGAAQPVDVSAPRVPVDTQIRPDSAPLPRTTPRRPQRQARGQVAILASRARQRPLDLGQLPGGTNRDHIAGSDRGELLDPMTHPGPHRDDADRGGNDEHEHGGQRNAHENPRRVHNQSARRDRQQRRHGKGGVGRAGRRDEAADRARPAAPQNATHGAQP
jgi:hypothetical protein